MSTFFRSADVVPLTSKVLLDRITVNGVAAVQADIEKVALRVWQYADMQAARDDTDGTEIETVLEVLSAACIFDALQRDAMWGKTDDVGYNCRVELPADRFPAGGKVYRVETLVYRTEVGADPFYERPWLLNAPNTPVD